MAAGSDRNGDTSTRPPDPPAVLAAALEAYLAFDTTGRVVAWNPAAEKTLRIHNRAQALGRSVEELIVRPQAPEAGRDELARLASGMPGQTPRADRVVAHRP